ncbi:MAG TPA: hypothetical protein VML19_09710 [Verrucomicrobiae bacterium]|nr:hypothetical protein [Verrucomicrobiae bacterium]
MLLDHFPKIWNHPFQSVLPGRRAILFVPLLCITSAVWIGKLMVEATLESTVTPGGLLALELAPDPQTGHLVVHHWVQAGLVQNAFFAVGLQFLWLLMLSSTLAFACVWSSQKSPGDWTNFGNGIAWLQWTGAVCGAIAAAGAAYALGAGSAGSMSALVCLDTEAQIVCFLLGALYAAAGFVAREFPRSRRQAMARL